mmetsp:Transcript_46649/g.149873  ORF Transcript_46649/g.149873 Transcript_46649/m.149873 type:complete len:232 (-) Transcript_46649:976-1671(-)
MRPCHAKHSLHGLHRAVQCGDFFQPEPGRGHGLPLCTGGPPGSFDQCLLRRDQCLGKLLLHPIRTQGGLAELLLHPIRVEGGLHLLRERLGEPRLQVLGVEAQPPHLLVLLPHLLVLLRRQVDVMTQPLVPLSKLLVILCELLAFLAQRCTGLLEVLVLVREVHLFPVHLMLLLAKLKLFGTEVLHLCVQLAAQLGQVDLHRRDDLLQIHDLVLLPLHIILMILDAGLLQP